MIYFAAFHNQMRRNLDLVKLLIRFGADVNTKCCGTPSLHLALFTTMLPEGKDFGLQCFDVLLQNSANILLKVGITKKECICF